jgi:two-component system chemotaxis response regulator CheY/two-component system phosphate regulon response regulator PhoB
MSAKIERAVIVEDDPQTRRLVQVVLSSLGIKGIVEAENGAAAIEALKGSAAHLAIMDWTMDVMDGLECTRRIRAGIEGIDPGLPIILLTGNVGTAFEAEAYAAGVDLFVEKPFSIRKLHGAITKVLAAPGRA